MTSIVDDNVSEIVM